MRSGKEGHTHILHNSSTIQVMCFISQQGFRIVEAREGCSCFRILLLVNCYSLCVVQFHRVIMLYIMHFATRGVTRNLFKDAAGFTKTLEITVLHPCATFGVRMKLETTINVPKQGYHSAAQV